jgi:hypothetical protein
VRHLIFALMIALLPLRGWIGDAMATQMAVHSLHQAQIESVSAQPPHQAGATEIIAAGAGNTWAAAPFDHHAASAQSAMSADCLEHGGASADPAGNDSGGACPDCAFCQACHTVALTSAQPSLSSSAQPGTLSQPAAAQFASADAAPGQKPPIS